MLYCETYSCHEMSESSRYRKVKIIYRCKYYSTMSRFRYNTLYFFNLFHEKDSSYLLLGYNQRLIEHQRSESDTHDLRRS